MYTTLEPNSEHVYDDLDTINCELKAWIQFSLYNLWIRKLSIVGGEDSTFIDIFCGGPVLFFKYLGWAE